MGWVDADAHVVESPLTWDYLLPSERKFRPQLFEPDDGSLRAHWVIDGKIRGLFRFTFTKDDLVKKSRTIGREMTTEMATRDLADVAGRIKHMDELGIDTQVVYPSIFLDQCTERADTDVALCGAYNRWMADVWQQGKGRLRWMATLPLLSIPDALDQLNFAHKHGACGIFMRGLEGDKRLSDAHFFPLYEEAGRLDLPICVHSATGSFAVHDFFLNECGFSKFKLAVVGSFHALVFHEVPARFPKTKFAFIEVSSQWVPYAIHDFARRFERAGKKVDKTDVLRQNRIYVACQTDDDLPYVLKYTGEGHLVIGTDYGHNDTSSEILALRKLKADGTVSPAVVNKILDDNARALYGL